VVYQGVKQDDDTDSLTLACMDISDPTSPKPLFVVPLPKEHHGMDAFPDMSVVAGVGTIRWPNGKITDYPITVAPYELIEHVALLFVNKSVYVVTGSTFGWVRVMNAQTAQEMLVMQTPTRAAVVAMATVPASNRIAWMDQYGYVSVMELSSS